MIWHDEDNTLPNASFKDGQGRPNLHFLANLRVRARLAQLGLRGPQHHDPHNLPDDGRGDNDSTPVS